MNQTPIQLTALLALGLATCFVPATQPPLYGQEKQVEAPVVELKDLVAPEHIEKYALQPYLKQSERWAKEIATMSATNSQDGSDNAILFLGSSSIKLWKTIDEDLPEWKAVRRGFGGSKFCDNALFVPNLVKGLKFQAAAIFVANDILGKETDKTPEEVARLAQSVIESVRNEVKDAPILIISITATPSRFKAWPKIEEGNKALEALAEKLDNVYFLDTRGSYLTSEGQPRPEFFVKDMLHQNKDGYKTWGKLVSAKLSEIPGLKKRAE